MTKLIVLDEMIGSMTEFKQIIGRGTRLREKEGKIHFVVMDFRNVTRLFADPDWDSERRNYSYSEVVIVGAGADAVDFKLISLLSKGDICVSQDYGVAAMALGKGCFAIHQSGKWYTNENIDQMLMERHLAKKARKSSRKHHLKGLSKRTVEDDLRFEESFEKMIRKALEI